MGGNKSRRLIAFDIFSNKYPNTKFKEDHAQRRHWKNSRFKFNQSRSTKKNSKKNQIDNFELISGDVVKTVPKFKKQNPGWLKFLLLNIDIDFVEPTVVCLKNFYDCVSKGGIILLDNYAGKDHLANIFTVIQQLSINILRIKMFQLKNSTFHQDQVS